MKSIKKKYLYSYRVEWGHADYTNSVSGIVSFVHISDYITEELARSLIMHKLVDNHPGKVNHVGKFKLLWCEEYYDEVEDEE